MYAIRWLFVPAGIAEMEVSGETGSDDLAETAFKFTLTAKTYPALDLLYKYRERVESYVSKNVERSLLYKKVLSGKSKRDIVVTFDWEKQHAQYTNFGEQREPISIEPGTLDPLSAFYHIRGQNLKEGLVLQRPVTDGKKVVIGRATVLKREHIRINGKTYDTFKIEPELKHVKGVFEKSKNAKMHIWVTADEKKMLVKLKSKVAIGSFTAELIDPSEATGKEEKNSTIEEKAIEKENGATDGN